MPAAFAEFIRSPTTGRAYWFGNILDHPVTGQLPRYPLALAEFDENRLCLVRDSVTIIQDLPSGAPACEREDGPFTSENQCGRRYTNWGSYIDRRTGEIVMTLPEQPKTSWDDFTSDCIEIRIRDDP